MKQAYIEGTFEHLIAHKNSACGRGRGSSARIALARAVSDLLKQPNIKGTRLTRFRASVVITDVAPTLSDYPKTK